MFCKIGLGPPLDGGRDLLLSGGPMGNRFIV